MIETELNGQFRDFEQHGEQNCLRAVYLCLLVWVAHKTIGSPRAQFDRELKLKSDGNFWHGSHATSSIVTVFNPLLDKNKLVS